MVLMARVTATMAMTFDTLDSLPRVAEDGDVLMVVVDENRSENYLVSLRTSLGEENELPRAKL